VSATGAALVQGADSGRNLDGEPILTGESPLTESIDGLNSPHTKAIR
jgi:hypothetical protein